MKTALFFLLLAQSVGAATYYVEPVNGDDTAAGTIGAPWKTIQRSVKYDFPVQWRDPGDTVYLRGGTYTGTGNAIDINVVSGALSGTEALPITIKAYPGETPIVSIGVASTPGILIKGLDWWRFEGISFTNCYLSVYIWDCSHFLFENCTFGSMYSGVTGYGGVTLWHLNSTCQYNIFRNCTFRDWGRVTDAGNDHGVSISIGDETADTQMYYNLVEGCTFIHGGHDHFQLNSAYNVIRNNLFVNDPWLNNAVYGTNLAAIGGVLAEPNPYGAFGNRHTKPGDAGVVQNDMRNVFEGNVFIYTGPPPDDYGAFGIELGTRRGIYRRNVIAYSLAAGIYFNASGTTTQSLKNCVYNNTIYENGLSHEFGGVGMQSYSYGVNMNTFEDRFIGNYLVNNIIRNNLPANLNSTITTYQEVRGNLTNDATNPLFVSTVGHGYTYNPTVMPNFRLNAGSPAIDAGVWLTTTVGAGSGTTLVLANSLYFSDGNQIVPGDTIQLQGQTATSVVTANDWENNTLTLSTPLTWTDGLGVALPYNGSAPDQGAFEREAGAARTYPVRYSLRR